MILPRFEIAEPNSVNEACDILRRNEKAKVIAGGTDLLVNMKRRVTKADPLVSLARISELKDTSFPDRGTGPYGAKEAGEGCILPVIPAILNAIYDACGVMIMDVPITSEKILSALEAKKKAGVSSYVLRPSKFADKIIDLAIEMSR